MEFGTRHLPLTLIDLVLIDTMALRVATAPAVVGWRFLRRAVQLIRLARVLIILKGTLACQTLDSRSQIRTRPNNCRHRMGFIDKQDEKTANC